ncbi:MAG: glycosyltransferase [Limimaricola sp.]|uniref:glycosyltransferase family 2 protein n=1 Tax=Limimaricola sp. TaxID=2211665 RepID=UPI001D99920E|nr:glycosyltransferase family 2 protein [Limimaricola sp.]MBI1415854.1 glycosyltransferase [Limimaricola sp.]
MSGLTCIIPAYNEAARIGAVLEAVVGHPGVDEVIVVDDGSTDGTPALVRAVTGARLIEMDRNGGKTRALLAGVAAAQGAHLMLIDADLTGLTPAHLDALIAPVTAGRAEVAISLRDNAPALWRMIGIDYISGERVLPKALLDGHEAALLNLPRFGFEVYLNRLLIARRAPVAVVRWRGVQSPLKGRKYGWRKGLVADAKMIGDMARSVGPMALVQQVVTMRRLRVS